MSVTVDFSSAINDAKGRVASANGRHAAACRRKRGVSDPRIKDSYRGELTTAVIACDITTHLANWPNLTVPQRVELIELLLPDDSNTVDHIINQLRLERGGGADGCT